MSINDILIGLVNKIKQVEGKGRKRKLRGGLATL